MLRNRKQRHLSSGGVSGGSTLHTVALPRVLPRLPLVTRVHVKSRNKLRRLLRRKTKGSRKLITRNRSLPLIQAMNRGFFRYPLLTCPKSPLQITLNTAKVPRTRLNKTLITRRNRPINRRTLESRTLRSKFRNVNTIILPLPRAKHLISLT